MAQASFLARSGVSFPGVVMSVARGQFTMRGRLEAAQNGGGYVDPVVLATREAREASAAYWRRSLDGIPAESFVVVEKATGFEAWRRTYDVLLYAAEFAIVTGGYADAVEHLKSARALRPGIPVRPPAPDRVGLPREALKRASQAFDQQLMRLAIEKKISGEEYLEFSAFLAER